MRGLIALLAIFYCTLCAAFATTGRSGIYFEKHPDNPAWCPEAYDAFDVAGKGCLNPGNDQCRYGTSGDCCESCDKDLVKEDIGKYCRWPYYLVCDATKGLLDLRSEQPGDLPCDECEVVGTPVIDGTTGEQLACITDPSVTTLATNEGEKVIATQCCSVKSNGKEDCHRWTQCTDGSRARNSQECCVSGHAKFEPVLEMTVAEAQAKCTDLELTFCQEPCNNKGCYYNYHPVWAAGTCKP